MKKISWLHFLKQLYYAYLFKNGKFKYTEMLEVKWLKKIYHEEKRYTYTSMKHIRI